MISRRNRLLFTFWILVLVAGISWAFHLRKPKVFVIGDSISMHYGPYLKRSLEGFFEYDRKRDERQAQEDLDNPIGATEVTRVWYGATWTNYCGAPVSGRLHADQLWTTRYKGQTRYK